MIGSYAENQFPPTIGHNLGFLYFAVAATGISLTYRWIMENVQPGAKDQEPATAG